MDNKIGNFDGSGSQEMVAFRLLHILADISNLKLHIDPNHASKEWILDTYAECLQATTGKRR